MADKEIETEKQAVEAKMNFFEVRVGGFVERFRECCGDVADRVREQAKAKEPGGPVEMDAKRGSKSVFKEFFADFGGYENLFCGIFEDYLREKIVEYSKERYCEVSDNLVSGMIRVVEGRTEVEDVVAGVMDGFMDGFSLDADDFGRYCDRLLKDMRRFRVLD